MRGCKSRAACCALDPNALTALIRELPVLDRLRFSRAMRVGLAALGGGYNRIDYTETRRGNARNA